MKTSILILALCLSSIFAREQEFAYASGRSGDIIIKPKDYKDRSIVHVVDDDVKIKKIDDRSFADLVSHLMGGPVISADVSRESFPKSSIFDKSTSNILFVVDSVDSEVLSQFEDLKMIKNGKSLKLKKTSYPQDNIASYATMFSGVSPSEHGIVGSQWTTQSGRISAYKVGALPYVQNLADSFSQLYEGKSLIYSSSSNFQMTSAFAVNQFVHSPYTNEIAIFFNSNTRKFESIYPDGIDISSLIFNAFNLTKGIAASPLPLPGKEDTMTYNEDYAEYTIKMRSKKIETTISAVDFSTFFAEILSVRNLNIILNTNANFTAMAADSHPDMFTFSFASLKGIEKKYGRNSDQYKVAIYLLDEIIHESISAFSSTYSKKISVQMVFMGKSADQAFAEDRKAKNEVYKIVKSSVRREVFESSFPSIVLAPNADHDIPCDALKALDYDLFCAAKEGLVVVDMVDFPPMQNQTVNGTKDAAVFHICLWSPIALALALIAVIIAFCTMDVGGDSIIYRQTITVRHPHSN